MSILNKKNMNLPIFEDQAPSKKEDSNFHSMSKKSMFKKDKNVDAKNQSFEHLMENQSMPSEMEILNIKTNGTSDVGNIFSYIDSRYLIDEMYLSTWVINKDNIDMLYSSLSKINKASFLFSNRLKQLKPSDYAYMLKTFSMCENLDFSICNTHAKVFAVKTKCENYFVVNGSGNWTSNPRIEYYNIINSKESFIFVKEWIEEINHGKKNIRRD